MPARSLDTDTWRVSARSEAQFIQESAPEIRDAFVDTVDRRWGHVPMDELEDWRDENMLVLLESLREAP